MTTVNPFDFTDLGAAPPPAPTAAPFAPAAAPWGIAPAAPPSAAPVVPWAPAPDSTATPAHPDPGAHSGFDPFADTRPRPLAAREVFGEAAAPTGPTPGALATASPPLALFAVATLLAAAGIAAGLLVGGALPAALGGWLAAGPLAIGALAAYTRLDTRRRAETLYTAPSWTGTAYWAVLAASLAGIAACAWQLALWAGRQ